MSEDARPRSGEIAWVDLCTSDPDAAGRFYGELFGWQLQDPAPASGGYRIATLDGEPVAGILPSATELPLTAWSVYAATADAAVAVRRAVAIGAVELLPATATSGGETVAMLADPGGAALGLWQPADPSRGQARDRLGAPSWYENHTKRFEHTVDFYAEVFGLQSEAVADTADAEAAPGEEEEPFRYSTLRAAGRDPAFGVFDAAADRPAELPSTWLVYFAVADADRSAERVIELGGSVSFGPEDSPYGRMATCVDPQGATFNLIQPIA